MTDEDTEIFELIRECYDQGGPPDKMTYDQLIAFAPVLGREAVNRILIENGFPPLDEPCEQPETSS